MTGCYQMKKIGVVFICFLTVQSYILYQLLYMDMSFRCWIGTVFSVYRIVPTWYDVQWFARMDITCVNFAVSKELYLVQEVSFWIADVLTALWRPHVGVYTTEHQSFRLGTYWDVISKPFGFSVSTKVDVGVHDFMSLVWWWCLILLVGIWWHVAIFSDRILG